MTPGIIGGLILSFARSLGEFGATITFVSNIRGQTQTLPLALYTFTQVPHGEALVALICSEILARRFEARMKG
jgi:molybdate transport system permease protein